MTISRKTWFCRSQVRGWRVWLTCCGAGVVASLLSGCQSPLVDPGATRALIPTRGAQPVGVPESASATAADDSARQDLYQQLERMPTSRVLNSQPARAGDEVYHSVRAGESLATIAAIYQITAEDIRRRNGLDVGTTVQPGDLLWIPKKR